MKFLVWFFAEDVLDSVLVKDRGTYAGWQTLALFIGGCTSLCLWQFSQVRSELLSSWNLCSTWIEVPFILLHPSSVPDFLQCVLDCHVIFGKSVEVLLCGYERFTVGGGG